MKETKIRKKSEIALWNYGEIKNAREGIFYLCYSVINL
jgi:hypothetical protein